ncbi:MAG: TrkA family potassium uptake protein [Candidatus Omnitrophica bacterium]|nr:TrkA family potassium uptake protein [Candidatus Omnitrophota bacterium]
MYVIIVGCGRVGAKLAELLSREGHNVVVIDKNPGAFKRLPEGFDGVTLEGSGFDLELLRQAGIEKADAFCSLTNGDNTNLVCAQIAKRIFNLPKVIARVYDPERAQIYQGLGLDVISGTILFAAMLRDKLVESRFSSFLIETKNLGVLEIKLKKEFVGRRVKEFNAEGEFLLVAIKRPEETFIPGPDTVLEANDVLMAVVKTDSLQKIKKRFGF